MGGEFEVESGFDLPCGGRVLWFDGWVTGKILCGVDLDGVPRGSVGGCVRGGGSERGWTWRDGCGLLSEEGG